MLSSTIITTFLAIASAIGSNAANKVTYTLSESPGKEYGVKERCERHTMKNQWLD